VNSGGRPKFSGDGGWWRVVGGADTDHYMAGGGDQTVPLMLTLVLSTPAKCVDVGLVLWLYQTLPQCITFT